MKPALRWALALTILPIAACSHNPPPMAAAPMAPAAPAPTVSPDQNFILTAAASDAFEIQSSQLAQDKARRPDVKDFAAQMIRDHGQTTQQLMQIQQGRGITPPPPQLTPDQQNMLAMLQKDTGWHFTHHYVHDQVMAHQMAISAFQQEASNGQDPAVKAFAQQTLPILQQHLQEAEQLASMRGSRHMMHNAASQPGM